MRSRGKKAIKLKRLVVDREYVEKHARPGETYKLVHELEMIHGGIVIANFFSKSARSQTNQSTSEPTISVFFS